MAYTPLGLAGLLVSAIRSAVADPEVKTQLAEQKQAIAAVRTGFDELQDRLETLTSNLAQNDDVDDAQREELEGIKTELAAMADALTGPADDDTDNGVIAEVQPVDTAEPSPAADEALAASES